MSSSRRIAIIDKRPQFEKALTYGVRERLIDRARCEQITEDGAKGTVQVAEYFGSSHLFTALDDACRRIVYLVSLFLQEQFGADLEQAACSLRDNSLLSHSRGGNAMLKALHGLPESSVFDYGDPVGPGLKAFQDECTLAKPLTHAAYRKEVGRRHGNQLLLDAAAWCAQHMQVPVAALDSVSAETVIRTAILVRLHGQSGCPNQQEFATLIEALRAKAMVTGTLRFARSLLDDMPAEFQAALASVRREISRHDVPLLCNPALPLDAVFSTLEVRYFLRETGVEDVDAFDAFVSQQWLALTKGKEDPYSRQTLFLCLAAGVKPKTTLSGAEARALVRQARLHGLDAAVVAELIGSAAPFSVRESLLTFWQEELFPEAQDRLIDASDEKLIGAMQFLAEHCNIRKK